MLPSAPSGSRSLSLWSIGTRLFLPAEWIDDPNRCRAVGVPEERIAQGARTKIELARELIAEAVANGVPFACVTFDAFYGRDSGLRRSIQEQGLVYCADVPANARVFGQVPELETRPEKITRHTLAVEELARRMAGDQRHPGQRMTLREGENGIVETHVWARRVWEWPAGQPPPEERWLIVRAMPDGTLKTSLSNAGAKTSLKRLARWQAGRFYVERRFQDAKSHCGMSEYQARGWRAWHHHMALVSLALLFLMEERLLHPLEMPLLSAADVVELMEWALVKRPTEDEMLERVRRRNVRRVLNRRNAVARPRKKSRAQKPHQQSGST